MTDEQVRQMWLDGQHDELAEQLMGISIAIASNLYRKTMRHTEVDQDDVVSWALESMWKAIQSWDPDSGVPLRGWIAFRVPRDIKNIQRAARCSRRGGHMRRVPLAWLEYLAGSLDLEGVHHGAHDPDPARRSDEERYADIVRPDTDNRLAHTMPAVKAEASMAAVSIDVWKALASLPEYQQQILHSLAAGATLRELGEELGMSHEWVRLEAEEARAHVRDCLS